jgi:cell division protein FtsQ
VSGSSLPPGVLRRKLLRQQRRAERLRNLWRMTVFSLIAAGLGYGLLRQGWTLRSPAQVEVVGSQLVDRQQVIRATGLRFPQSLLTVQPKQLDEDLRSSLPVEQVRISRLMLPPRLRVELVDREAVARAERRGRDGLEQGYIDRQGHWIAIAAPDVVPRGDLSLRVRGWNERHRSALTQILDRREVFGGGLQEVRFAPDGSLWLTTRELGPMRLGPADDRLERRLEVAAHLNDTLPAQLKGRSPTLIDLSDPEQPELSVPGVAPPPPKKPGTNP